MHNHNQMDQSNIEQELPPNSDGPFQQSFNPTSMNQVYPRQPSLQNSDGPLQQQVRPKQMQQAHHGETSVCYFFAIKNRESLTK